MEVYQVKVFLEVARHLSFTEASDVLNLTQPAVSAKIKSLELELGTSLFYRLGRKIQLTEVGEFLFEEGMKLVEIENLLIEKIAEIKKGKLGNLRIGSTSGISEAWLPEVIFKYSRLYTGVQVKCLEFETAELLYRAISEGQIDLGISDISFNDFSEISALPIDTIHYSLVVSDSHPLAYKKWLSLEDLKDPRWVMLPVGSPSRMILESRLIELGLEIKEFEIETVSNLDIMRTFITHGNYIAFTSEFEFNPEHQAGKLVSIPLQEFALPGDIYLIQSKRISEFTKGNVDRFAVKSRGTNPIQKFIALVQSLPIVETSPVRIRSPNLILRTANLQRPDLITLTIGIQNCTIPTVTAGLIIKQLRLLEHFLPKDGRYNSTKYDICWRDFSSGAPIVEGLHSGHLNIGILGDYPLLLSAVNREQQPFDTRLVSFISHNPNGGGNALIVPYKSDFSDIRDFKNKVIAVPFGSSAHGMVIRSLYSAELLPCVKLTALNQTSANQVFTDSCADGYAHFAPFHNIACQQGKYRYLPSDHQSALPTFHGVVVSAILADHYPEVVIAYLKALKAAQYWLSHSPESISLISNWTQIDPEIVAQFIGVQPQEQGENKFFNELAIRTDWIKSHISQLSLITGYENLGKINLNQWVQADFLQKVNV